MSRLTVRISGELESYGYIVCNDSNYIYLYGLSLNNLTISDSNGKLYCGDNPFLFSYSFNNGCLFGTHCNFIDTTSKCSLSFYDSIKDSNVCNLGSNFKSALFLEMYINDEDKNKAYIILKKKPQGFNVNKGDYLTFEFKMEINNRENDNNNRNITLKKIIKK